MSERSPEADVQPRHANVAEVPKADIVRLPLSLSFATLGTMPCLRLGWQGSLPSMPDNPGTRARIDLGSGVQVWSS